MKSNRFVALALAAALPSQVGLAFAAPPQEKPASEAAAPAQTEVPVFSVGTAAVTLDVVVRDKKGNAVRDLNASDFEVFEDGVKQKVESFKVYGHPLSAPDAGSGKTSTPAAVAAAPAAPEATEAQAQVIAFVFDRLSVNARNLAQKAALTYLEKGHVDGDLVGIFSIDLALHSIQPFTTDPGLIRAGLERAASQGNTQFAGDRRATRDLIDTVTRGDQATDAASNANPSGPGAGSAAQGIAASAASGAISSAVASMQVGMLRSFEALEQDQQGYATTNGLMAVVSGLKSLPGRKTVVFFSEGLSLPPNVQAQFKSVIATANRSNVSVYAMDAGGLRANSSAEETRNEMLQAQARRLRQLDSGRDDASNGVMTKNLERNEALLTLDPESGLGRLANETGGFLIHDTNDAGSAFRRIEEDMRFYYLLAYSPSNEAYDGKFRTISVKVARSGVQVQTRQGYLALKPSETTAPVKTFEAPAIAVLDRSKQPDQFPLQIRGLSFPEAERPGLVPVLVHVPGNIITYEPDKDDKSGKKMNHADFAVVVRVRNEAKQEVDRLSQRYVLSAPEANLEAARKGELLFYRQADLAPGRYTLEAVGYDAVSEKASVRSATIEVPKVAADRVRLSSVVLVRRAEKVEPSDKQRENPLFYGETIIYPDLGEPFHKATSPALGFFFTAYAGKDAAAPKKATIQIYRGEMATGEVMADLPAPDASGRVQYAGALPLQGFPPGAYKLKVSVSNASGVDSSQAAFTVAE
jgi:VWFA-related protein